MYQYLRRLMDVAENVGTPESVFMSDTYVSVEGRCKVYGEDTKVTFLLSLNFKEEKNGD